MCSQPSGDRNCSSSPSTGLPASTNPWVARSVHRVPQHDSRRHQVEAAGPVALLLEAPIPDFPKAVEEHRPGQRVARLTFVQAGMHAAAQFNTLQPVGMNSVRSIRPSSRRATASPFWRG